MTKTVIDSAATADATSPARAAFAEAAAGRTGALRAGFIGAGFMAAVHSRAARAARATLAGAAASSSASAEQAAALLGLERSYSSVNELLSDGDIDVVHICTPNTTHAPFALAALTPASTSSARSRWRPRSATRPSWPAGPRPAASARQCPSSTASTRWCARPAPAC